MPNHLYPLPDLDFEDSTLGPHIGAQAKLLAAGFNIKPGFVVTPQFFQAFSKTDLLAAYTNLQVTKHSRATGLKKLTAALVDHEVSITVSLTSKVHTPRPGFANFAQSLKTLAQESNSPLLVQLVAKNSDEVTVSSGYPIVITTTTGTYTTSKASPQLVGDSVLSNVLHTFFELEKFYYFPITARFIFENTKVYVTQVSFLEERVHAPEKVVPSKNPTPLPTPKLLFTGKPGNPGLRKGPIKIIHSSHDFKKVHFGDILLTRATTPQFDTILKRCCGIIVEHSDRYTHTVTFAKHHGIPCVLGVNPAAVRLRDNQVVNLNGTTGEVWL